MHDKLCSFGFVTMFVSAVFGFLPMCASKSAIIVTQFGISLMLCIILATIVDMSSDDHSGSSDITPSLRFMVWINLSTITVALWSTAGASFNLVLLSLENTLKSLDLNA